MSGRDMLVSGPWCLAADKCNLVEKRLANLLADVVIEALAKLANSRWLSKNWMCENSELSSCFEVFLWG